MRARAPIRPPQRTTDIPEAIKTPFANSIPAFSTPKFSIRQQFSAGTDLIAETQIKRVADLATITKVLIVLINEYVKLTGTNGNETLCKFGLRYRGLRCSLRSDICPRV